MGSEKRRPKDRSSFEGVNFHAKIKYLLIFILLF